MTLRSEYYHHHFNEEQLIQWMYLRDYNDVVIESITAPNHFYNVVIDGYNDNYEDYYFEYVELVPSPNKYDLDMARDYSEWLKTKKPIEKIEAKYEDDTYVLELIEND